MKPHIFIAAAAFAVLSTGCGQDVKTVAEFPINSTEGIISQSAVTFDAAISSDGNGSAKIVAADSMTLRLFEVTAIEIEPMRSARLTYQAKLHTENLRGKAFLEMWCQFQGKGRFFSRDLQNPLTGTTEWTTVQTPFFLKPGEKPELVLLNLVITGPGTVWVDEVELLQAPGE